MARYRKIRLVTPAQAAYIAGLIDGEGTITLTRLHRNENRRIVVSISNNERKLLEFVREVTGIGRITTKRKYKEHHSQSFTYSAANRQAIDLLKQLASYLQTYKAQRAALVLRHYLRLTPRNGKYTPAMRGKRTRFENQVLALKARRSHAM